MAQQISCHDLKELDLKAEQNTADPCIRKQGLVVEEQVVKDALHHAVATGETLPTTVSTLTGSWHAGDDSLLDNEQEQARNDDYFGRRRGTSISFNPQAVTDDGSQHTLEKPLPRSGSLRSMGQDQSLTRNSSMSSVTSSRFDPDRVKVNPFTGEPVRRRTRRSEVAPKLERVESERAVMNDDINTVRTPLTDAGTFMGSPTMVTTPNFSPMTESEPWPVLRQDSNRSGRGITSRPMSLRRETRRSSTMRSMSNSGSPASAFLSQWGRESVSSMPPDPEDEGQTFGVNNEYVIGRQIGYGGFSVVKEAITISDSGDKVKRAVKMVRKIIPEKTEADNERCQQELDHEVEIWRYVSHKNILPLHAVYDTESTTFCVMDLVDGGSLYDLVRSNRRTSSSTTRSQRSHVQGLSAKQVKSYAFQLASALRYLHEDVRIVHRDVKLENCLVDYSSDFVSKSASSRERETPLGLGRLRLCDFGLASFISHSPQLEPQQVAAAPSADPSRNNSTVSTMTNGTSSTASADGILGSLAYASPETLTAASPLINPATDVWSYGVCVYALCTGDLPFRHGLQAKLVDMIIEGQWDREAVRTCMCTTADDKDVDRIVQLLSGCLEKNAGQRLDISDVLASTWFDDCREAADA